MEIRTAVEADIPRIVEIYKQLFALSARMQPERFRDTPQDEAFLREVVAAGDQELFVADDAGEVCGFALGAGPWRRRPTTVSSPIATPT